MLTVEYHRIDINDTSSIASLFFGANSMRNRIQFTSLPFKKI